VADDPLEGCNGFDWDDGNLENEPLVVSPDRGHSMGEPRYLALGQTDSGRRLFISFTIRGSLVRIISARDMTRKELGTYEQSKA